MLKQNILQEITPYIFSILFYFSPTLNRRPLIFGPTKAFYYVFWQFIRTLLNHHTENSSNSCKGFLRSYDIFSQWSLSFCSIGKTFLRTAKIYWNFKNVYIVGNSFRTTCVKIQSIIPIQKIERKYENFRAKNNSIIYHSRWQKYPDYNKRPL